MSTNEDSILDITLSPSQSEINILSINDNVENVPRTQHTIDQDILIGQLSNPSNEIASPDNEKDKPSDNEKDREIASSTVPAEENANTVRGKVGESRLSTDSIYEMASNLDGIDPSDTKKESINVSEKPSKTVEGPIEMPLEKVAAEQTGMTPTDFIQIDQYLPNSSDSPQGIKLPIVLPLAEAKMEDIIAPDKIIQTDASLTEIPETTTKNIEQPIVLQLTQEKVDSIAGPIHTIQQKSSSSFSVSDVNVDNMMPMEDSRKSDHSIATSLSISVVESKKSESESIINSSLSEKIESQSPIVEITLLESSISVGSQVRAVKAHHPEELDELWIEMGDLIEIEEVPEDEYWIKGSLHNAGTRTGQIGYFPRQNVVQSDVPKEIFDTSRVASVPPELQLNNPISPVPKGTTVVALYSYEPSKQDELQFLVGAIIIVIECPEGGWWKGITGMDVKNPITGWFPANLVKVVEKNKSDPSKLESSPSETLPDMLSPQKQVSWFKRLKSPDNATPDINKRIRSPSSAMSTTSVLESSHESIVENPSALKKKEESKLAFEETMSSRSSLVLRQSTVLDDTRGRSSINLGKGAFDLNRGSLGLSKITMGGLSQAEILKGATDEKVQDRIPSTVYKFLSDQEKKRLSVVWELVQTERDFVRDLHIIVESFLKPMSPLASMGSKNIQLLFANIEQILLVNTDFLGQLLQIDDIRNITAFAEIFLTMGERFMCYIPYCSNQQAVSAKVIKTLLSKSDVKAYLDEIYKNAMLRQLDLPGFLLKPVQRICKYPLLLKEMIKNTSKDHSDMVVLNRANERMQNAVSTINECAKRLNGMKTVQEVQTRFSEKINIANSNRFLVREDVIHVLFNNGKKSRKLFLFNDLLILARKDWRDKHHVIEKTSVKDIRICDIAETGGNESETLLIELEILPNSEFDPPNRYIISASSVPEKLTWLDAYKSLVRYHVKSKDISDITMTSSNADGGDDDDIAKEITESERKVAAEQQMEASKKPLLEKIYLLEKILSERDAKIKDWELKVQHIEEASILKEKVASDKYNLLEIESKEKLITVSNKLKETETLLSAAETELNINRTECNDLKSQQLKLLGDIKEYEDNLNIQYQEINDLSEERVGVVTRLQQLCVSLGVRPQSQGRVKSIPSLRSSISVTKQFKDSNPLLNQIEKIPELLDLCENAVLDLKEVVNDRMLSLQDKTNALNILHDQHAQLKREYVEKESGLTSSLTIMKKKISDMEESQSELSNQISLLKKEKVGLENIVEEHKTQVRKLIADKEGHVFELQAHLKRETDRAKLASEKVEELSQNLMAKETALKEALQNHQHLHQRLQATQGDISEKDSTVKQLIDRSNIMKEALDEIRLVFETVRKESSLVVCNGSLASQFKSLFEDLNTSINTHIKTIKSLEASKLLEYQEAQLIIGKLKEKNSTYKEELEESKNELEISKKALSQLKTNLEQTKTIVEQAHAMQISQLQSNLDNSINECITLKEKRKGQQIVEEECKNKIIELEKELQSKRLLIDDLQPSLEKTTKKLKLSEILIEELKNRMEEMDKTLKEKVDEHETLLNSLKQHHSVEVDRLTFDHNREVHNFHNQITDLEKRNDLLQLQNHQRDGRINDLEQLNGEIKFKLHDQDVLISQLEGKLSLRETKLADQDSEIMILSKQITQHKAKTIELENNLINSLAKNSEQERAVQRLESNLSASSSNIHGLEQRVLEYTRQIDELNNAKKDLQVEKKNLLHDFSRLEAETASLNKELKLSKEKIIDMNAAITKGENNMIILQKDHSRTIFELEEAYKHTISKHLGEKEKELSEAKSQYHSLEKNLENKEEQLRQAMEKNSVLERTRISKEMENADLLRELSKLRLILEKEEKDLNNLKSAHQMTEESEYSKLKAAQRENDFKMEELRKKQSEIEKLVLIIDEKNNVITQAKYQNSLYEKELVEMRSKLDGLNILSKESESRYIAAKEKMHDLGIQYHESLLLNERIKVSEENLKEALTKTRAELDKSQETVTQQNAYINSIQNENKKIQKELKKSQLKLEQVQADYEARVAEINASNIQSKELMDQVARLEKTLASTIEELEKRKVLLAEYSHHKENTNNSFLEIVRALDIRAGQRFFENSTDKSQRGVLENGLNYQELTQLIKDEYLKSQEIQKNSLKVVETKYAQLVEKYEKSLSIQKEIEMKYIQGTENLQRIAVEKDSLERDYLKIYEVLQETRNEYNQRSKSLATETASIIEQNNLALIEINSQKEQAKGLIERLKQFTLERHSWMEQKSKLEALLSSVKLKTTSYLNQIDQLQHSNDELVKDKLDLELKIQFCHGEIEDLKDRLQKDNAANQLKIRDMAQSIKDADLCLDGFRKQLKDLSQKV